MKRVIVKEQSDTVDLHSLKEEDCMHVGVVYNNEKYFLQERKGSPYIDCFFARSRAGININNEFNTFRLSVEFQVSKGREVYIFETSKELLKWLSE